MAIDMLSPGVYTQELDFSDYVASISGCIVGMVGGAQRGPITPTLVTSQKQFVQLFGEPVNGDYGAISALVALSKVNQLYYCRVAHTATPAKSEVTATDRLRFTTKGKGISMNDLTVKVVARGNDDFDITVLRKANETELATAPQTTQIELEKFEHVAINPDNKLLNGKMVADVTSESTHIIVGVANDEQVAVTTKDYQLTGGTSGASQGFAGTDKTRYKIATKYLDSTLNYCTVTFTQPDDFGYFSMILMSEDGSTVIERLDNLTTTAGEHFVETQVANASNYIKVTYNKDATDNPKNYTIINGNDGIKGLTPEDIIGTDQSGLKAFANPEVLDISILSAPGWFQDKVVRSGLSICKNRGECHYISGTPRGLTPQQANAWFNGSGEYASDHSAYDTCYGSGYWPWVKIANPVNNESVWIPPEGRVIAQYAYNDEVGDCWTAPAGLNRGKLDDVLDIEYYATQGERDAMYGNRNVVNPIINYKGTGFTIWGQKTFQRKPTALDRVNVRRLMNYVEKIISTATAYFLFEDNHSYQWGKWIDMVEPKLSIIKERRGIVDYKIQMNPTESEIENYTMPGTIMIKPTKTAEFIPISYMITRQGLVLNPEANK